MITIEQLTNDTFKNRRAYQETLNFTTEHIEYKTIPHGVYIKATIREIKPLEGIRIQRVLKFLDKISFWESCLLESDCILTDEIKDILGTEIKEWYRKEGYIFHNNIEGKKYGWR